RMGWAARLLIALVFILVGAGTAIWSLGHYPRAARVLGVESSTPQPAAPAAKPTVAQSPVPAPAPEPNSARIAALEQRVAQVENAEARYQRASQRLATGDVDQALAETMRMPGASRAGDWIAKARRYVAAHRALDEIESAALMAGPGSGR